MKLFLYTAFFMFVAFTKAQSNLVPNPSFETYTNCPTGSSQIYYAPPWTGPTTNSTDYINACSSVLGVPNHGADFQYPRTGNAYAGLYAVDGVGVNYREYLQAPLISPLVAGKCYYVSFYVSLDNGCLFGSNNMAAHLSNTTYGSNLSFPGNILNLTAHALKLGNPVITDTMNWEQVSGIYKAIGGENSIIIGNFKNDKNTDTAFVGGTYGGAYYNIDDVSVTPIDSIPMPAYAGKDISICLGDSTFIGQRLYGLNCNWYSNSQLIDTNISGIYVKPGVATTYVVEQNLCGTLSYDTVIVSIKPNLKGNVTLATSSKNACANQNVQLQATVPNSTDIKWNWLPVNVLNNAAIPNPTASLTVNTSFQLIATAGVTSNYCGTDTSKINIYVIAPQSPANAGMDTTLCDGLVQQIIIGNNNNTCKWCTYNWQPATGIQNPNSSYTVLNLPNSSQTYVLSKTDSCQTSKDTIHITIKDCGDIKIIAPNIFSPNNDDINDTWSMLVLNGLELFDIQTDIYNRWGTKVFESTNIHQDWNGNNLYTGNTCSVGTYFYIISYTDGNTNETKTLKGFLELER